MRNHLVSCATSLSFVFLSTVSWAQTSQYRVLRINDGSESELATPSTYFSPQSGTQVELSYAKSQQKLESESGKYRFLDQNRFGAGLATAITPNLYVGLKTNYQTGTLTSQSGTLSSENKMQGVGDPSLFFGGRLNLGPLSLLAEIDFQIGSGDSDATLTQSGDIESNVKQGGNSVTPHLSLFTNRKDSLLIGADLSYEIRQERAGEIKSETSGRAISIRMTGGNTATASLFLESPQITHSLGLLAAYSKVEDSEQKALNTTASLSSSEIGTLMAYANLKVGRQIQLQPAIGYNRILNDKDEGESLSSQNSVVGSLSARLSF